MKTPRIAAAAALCLAVVANAQDAARAPARPIDWRPTWVLTPQGPGVPSPYMQPGVPPYPGWSVARQTGPDIPVTPVVRGAAASPNAKDIQLPSAIGDRYAPELSPCWAGGEYCDPMPRLQIMLVPPTSRCAPPCAAGDCMLMR